MSYKAALFDLDGVLVDTAKYHYLAWKELADRLGFVFTEEHNERLKGVSRMASLDILLEVGGIKMTAEEKEKAAKEKNDRYVEYISHIDASELLPGAAEYLKALRTRDIKIALGSASKNAVVILKNTGILALFDVIIDGNSVSKAKPDPEVFALGAERLGIPAAECVVFEDAAAGIKAAHNAGMLAVGIGKPSVLSEADYVIGGLYEASRIETIWD